MDLFLTDFSNGYHLSSKGIKTFLEMPIGAEKKSQATDNRLKKSFIWDTGQHPCSWWLSIEKILGFEIKEDKWKFLKSAN